MPDHSSLSMNPAVKDLFSGDPPVVRVLREAPAIVARADERVAERGRRAQLVGGQVF